MHWGNVRPIARQSVPTWENIRTASDELDQMASQTVLKACDVGDMLREIRLTMETEKFYQECLIKLKKDRDTVSKLIVLSFRRAAVLEALANGKANDSIRSAYEHVKGLPAPDEETSEREQWPRAKRGPEPGNGGRPKTITLSDVERAAWDEGLKEGGQMIADFAEREAERKQVKADLAQQPSHQDAAAIYRDILGHLSAADNALAESKDLAYFDMNFWDAAMAHATRIVNQLEKISCK